MDWLSELTASAQTRNAEDWVAWLYVLTNSLRVFAYAPQIRAVLKAEDGAVGVSITTWGLFTFANLTAMLYGWLVIHDNAFCTISMGNVACTTAVTLIAIRKRFHWRASRNYALADATSPA